jgi:hypothetical protein
MYVAFSDGSLDASAPRVSLAVLAPPEALMYVAVGDGGAAIIASGLTRFKEPQAP